MTVDLGHNYIGLAHFHKFHKDLVQVLVMKIELVILLVFSLFYTPVALLIVISAVSHILINSFANSSAL